MYLPSCVVTQDHQAIVVTICAGKWRLKAYERQCQKIPMQLSPQELRDDLTTAFEALKATCEEPEAAKSHWRNWVSEGTWLLIKKCMSLQRAGRLHCFIGQCMQHAIHAVLKTDRTARTAQAGDSIVTDLAKGNVHEAFCHLKGWYRAATETQARPCFHTIKRQTVECIDLYQRCDSLDPPVTINVAPADYGMTCLPMGRYGPRLPS